MSVKGILTEQFPTAEQIGAATDEALAQVGTNVESIKSTVESNNTKIDSNTTTLNTIKTATAANSTASKTGTLSQKDAYIISLLENATYGLNALKTAINSASSSSSSVVKSVQRGVLSFSSATATATINAVDVNKAIVVYGGSSYSRDRDGGTPQNSGSWDARLTLINSTTVTATVGYYANYTGPTAWQVIEFY